MRDRAIFNLYSNAVTVGNNGEFVLDKDQNPITIDETPELSISLFSSNLTPELPVMFAGSFAKFIAIMIPPLS